jgi:hypothetical protein
VSLIIFMSTILQSSFDTLRGGTKRMVSFAEFIGLPKDKNRKLVVEGVVVPELGSDSWGGFIVREGATKVLPRFRR